MPMQRVAELVGGRYIRLKTMNRNRLEQKFFFDGVTKTIRSRKYTNKSMQIASNGNGSYMEMMATNSRWW